jgi:hypothetical protein
LPWRASVYFQPAGDFAAGHSAGQRVCQSAKEAGHQLKLSGEDHAEGASSDQIVELGKDRKKADRPHHKLRNVIIAENAAAAARDLRPMASCALPPICWMRRPN